jgi:hypothetical protein
MTQIAGTAPQRFRIVWHLLPTLLVVVCSAAILLFGALAFSAVFVIDDAFDGRAFVAGLAGAAGIALALALLCFALGAGLDRLTTGLGPAIRLPVPLPLVLAGGIWFAVDRWSYGLHLMIVGAIFVAYWMVLLVQRGIARLVVHLAGPRDPMQRAAAQDPVR